MTMENKYSPLPTWRLLTLLPPRISLISKRKPAREGRLLALICLGGSLLGRVGSSPLCQQSKLYIYAKLSIVNLSVRGHSHSIHE